MRIPENWTFKNDEIAANFDAHVNEQLPWYGMALDMTAHIAKSYLQDGGTLIDLGCSTGAVTRALESTIIDRKINAISIDNSPEMISMFTGFGEVEIADMQDVDRLPFFDVCVCFLAVMFTRPDSRAEFLFKIKNKCRPGGVVIIVDKLEQAGGYMGTVISRMAISNKLEAGVDADSILKKELSLSGAQRPSDPALYSMSGFIEWLRVGDFVGVVYERSVYSKINYKDSGGLA